MDRRRNKRHQGNWKGQNQNQNKNKNQNQNSSVFEKKDTFRFNKTLYENAEAETQRLQAITELKSRENICPMCNQPITELASCLADKASGMPVHFDCAIEKVRASEPTGENEKVAYIGQGRFAVLAYENIRDQRHFTIKKIIEWEERDKKSEWRDEYSSLYSKIN